MTPLFTTVCAKLCDSSLIFPLFLCWGCGCHTVLGWVIPDFLLFVSWGCGCHMVIGWVIPGFLLFVSWGCGCLTFFDWVMFPFLLFFPWGCGCLTFSYWVVFVSPLCWVMRITRLLHMNHTCLHSSIVMSHVRHMSTPHGPCAKAHSIVLSHMSHMVAPLGPCATVQPSWLMLMQLAQPLMTHSVTGHVSMVTFVDMWRSHDVACHDDSLHLLLTLMSVPAHSEQM